MTKTDVWQRADTHLRSGYRELVNAMSATGPNGEAEEYNCKLDEVMETVCSAIDEVSALGEWARSLGICAGDDA